MLYQKGEKLKELTQTIKDIPKLSGLDEALLVMSNEDFSTFITPINNLFEQLNKALFSTLSNYNCQQTKTTLVTDACDKIICYLKENHINDLINNFYENKADIYENLFVDLINKLMLIYPHYAFILKKIPEAYAILANERGQYYFGLISVYIKKHKELHEDLKNGNLHDSTRAYIIHSMELILENICNLIKEECSEPYTSEEDFSNNLRKLIFVLKKELINTL